MRIRTIAAGAAVLALALSACSSDETPDRPVVTKTVTASPTPTVDRAAARQACVKAWRELLDAGTAEAENQPAVCDQVPGQAAAMYAEALRERNEANRERLDDCLDDPSCTEMPLP